MDRPGEATSPTLAEFVEQLASSAPVPGGGSAAAVAGAMGAALLAMVVALSQRKSTAPARERLQSLTGANHLWRRFLYLARADSEAYRALLALRKPPDTPGRGPLRAAALAAAARVPLETATLAREALTLAGEVGPLCWPAVTSDLTTARALLSAALDGALANVAANLSEVEGAERAAIETAYQALRAGR